MEALIEVRKEVYPPYGGGDSSRAVSESTKALTCSWMCVASLCAHAHDHTRIHTHTLPYIHAYTYSTYNTHVKGRRSRARGRDRGGRRHV